MINAIRCYFNVVILKETIDELQELELLSTFYRLKIKNETFEEKLLSGEFQYKNGTKIVYKNDIPDCKLCNYLKSSKYIRNFKRIYTYPVFRNIYFMTIDELVKSNYHVFSSNTFVLYDKNRLTTKQKKILSMLKNRVLKFNVLHGFYSLYVLPRITVHNVKFSNPEKAYWYYYEGKYHNWIAYNFNNVINFLKTGKIKNHVLYNRMATLDISEFKKKATIVENAYDFIINCINNKGKCYNPSSFKFMVATTYLLDDFFVCFPEEKKNVKERVYLISNVTRNQSYITQYTDLSYLILFNAFRDKYNLTRYFWKTSYKINKNKSYKEINELIRRPFKNKRTLLNIDLPDVGTSKDFISNFLMDISRISKKYISTLQFSVYYTNVISKEYSIENLIEYFDSYYKKMAYYGFCPNIKEIRKCLMDIYGGGFNVDTKFILEDKTYMYKDDYSEFIVFKPACYFSAVVVPKTKIFYETDNIDKR